MEESKKQFDQERADRLKAALDKALDKIVDNNDPERCALCHKPEVFKTDGQGFPLCERCASPVTLPIRAEFKPKRNAPCSCQSGLKYKFCCLNKSV